MQKYYEYDEIGLLYAELDDLKCDILSDPIVATYKDESGFITICEGDTGYYLYKSDKNKPIPISDSRTTVIHEHECVQHLSVKEAEELIKAFGINYVVGLATNVMIENGV